MLQAIKAMQIPALRNDPASLVPGPVKKFNMYASIKNMTPNLETTWATELSTGDFTHFNSACNISSAAMPCAILSSHKLICVSCRPDKRYDTRNNIQKMNAAKL